MEISKFIAEGEECNDRMGGGDLYERLQESLARLHTDLADQIKEFARPRFNLKTEEEPLTMPEFPDPLERLDAARSFVSEILQTIETWQAENTDGVVSLVMADGGYMLLSSLDPLGFNGFIAKGAVDGAPFMVTGHITNLTVIGVTPSKPSETGFRARLPPKDAE
jgi:hypothetical protein